MREKVFANCAEEWGHYRVRTGPEPHTAYGFTLRWGRRPERKRFFSRSRVLAPRADDLTKTPPMAGFPGFPRRGWWSGWGSNPRPSRCERDALPAALPPHEVADYTEPPVARPAPSVSGEKIGRASWREGVCQSVYISVVAGALKK